MPDILIRGMEMSKDWDLWLCIDTGGTVYNVKPVITGTAQEVGTAIPLPEGHGKIIDGDALWENMTVRLPDDSRAVLKPGYGWDEIAERLAAYEDTGLEPEEVEAAKEIVARLALADYPHNFQGERSDIASYMYWITSVIKEAKAWWKKLLKAREDAEKALEGIKNEL